MLIGYFDCVVMLVQYGWFMPDNAELNIAASVVIIAMHVAALWWFKRRWAIEPLTMGLGLRAGLSIALVRGVVSATCYYIICTADAEYLSELVAMESRTLVASGMPRAEVQKGIEAIKELMQPGVMFVTNVIGALFEGLIVTVVAMAFMRERRRKE